MSNEKSATRQPAFRAYAVNGEGDSATWTPIGAAWPIRNGTGYNVALEAVPTNGRLILLPPKVRKDS